MGSGRSLPTSTGYSAPGTVAASFGVHCAQLAGLRSDVLQRAEHVIHAHSQVSLRPRCLMHTRRCHWDTLAIVRVREDMRERRVALRAHDRRFCVVSSAAEAMACCGVCRVSS